MLFSSMTFIYVFLPTVFFLYYFSRDEYRNLILLIASFIFYGWAEPTYVLIMLATILINYTTALCIDRYRRFGLPILISGVFLDLAILFYFKYFNFFVTCLNQLTHAHFNFIEVIMPIGISFYTFQAISYAVDVYRSQVPVQRNLLNVALYISLFPQLVAGPIVKYHDISQQISSRKVSFELVCLGVQRFIIGLGKKVLIANNMGLVADNVFALPVEQVDTGMAWIGAVAYSLQLFFDFSGYSDMAIGLGLIFGFRFLENFNYPYISKSITEFWRRWHISLSTWFKEYLYIPLGGNRVSKTRNYINLWIVFFCTGFWHGAAWNFIFWGLWHGAFIVLEKATGWHKNIPNVLSSAIHHLYVLFIVIVGWVFFRAEDLPHAWNYLKNMFGCVQHAQGQIAYGPAYFYDNMQIIFFVIGLVLSTPIFKVMYERFSCRTVFNLFLKSSLLVVFCLSTISIATSTYNPFIYFRF